MVNWADASIDQRSFELRQNSDFQLFAPKFQGDLSKARAYLPRKLQAQTAMPQVQGTGRDAPSNSAQVANAMASLSWILPHPSTMAIHTEPMTWKPLPGLWRQCQFSKRSKTLPGESHEFRSSAHPSRGPESDRSTQFRWETNIALARETHKRQSWSTSDRRSVSSSVHPSCRNST